MLARCKEAFTFNWLFWFALTGAMLIPKLYEMNRVWLVGAMDMSSLAIVEQYRFIELAIEVVNESFPIAVLALVAQSVSPQQALPIVKTAAVTVGSVSLALMVGIWGGATLLVDTIGTSTQLIEVTKAYLRVRSLGLVFDSLALVALMGLKGRQKGLLVVFVTLITIVSSTVVDNVLYGKTVISLGLGIEGVAYGYVISKGILFCSSWWALFRACDCTMQEFISVPASFFLQLFNIGKYTGADSLVRNLFYGCTLVLLNTLGANEYGGYGLTMSIMWSALIPILALAEQTNIAVGAAYATKKKNAIYQALFSSLGVLGVLVLILVVAGTSWNVFAASLNSHAEIVSLSKQAYSLLLIPYCIFTLDLLTKSIFIGTGRTKYILYTTVLVGGVVSLPGLLLYRFGIWSPDFQDLMVFLGAGFVVDFICSFYFARRLLARI